MIVIGGKSGLGAKIAQHFNATALGRPDYDISTVTGRNSILYEIHLADEDVIVLNAYDRDVPQSQLRLARDIWDEIKHKNKTLVVISSAARYFASLTEAQVDKGFIQYCNAKRDLSEICFSVAWGYPAKMVIIEPSYIESKVEDHRAVGKFNMTYLTYDEYLEMIEDGLKMAEKSQVVVLSRVGKHTINEFTSEQK